MNGRSLDSDPIQSLLAMRTKKLVARRIGGAGDLFQEYRQVDHSPD